MPSSTSSSETKVAGNKTSSKINSSESSVDIMSIDNERCRYPYCVVWTPIPVLSWIFPFIGHMGICTSTGVIRDFAGPYHVSEDQMAFGNPTKYWSLCPMKASGGQVGWDSAVHEASEIYKKRMHILCYDNCHSHVAKALNLMSYNGSERWNMLWLAIYMIIFSKYVSFLGFLRTNLPPVLFYTIVILMIVYLP